MACCSISFVICYGFNKYSEYDIQKNQLEQEYSLKLKQLEFDKEKLRLDYESAKADRVDKQKTLQEFADIAKESMKNVSKIIEPIEALIKQMDKDDKVYLGDKIY